MMKQKVNWLVGLGGLGLMAGALMPWVVLTSIFGTLEVVGMDGDGKITAVLGLLILVVAVVGRGLWGRLLEIILGVAAFSLAIFAYNNVAPMVAEAVADDMLASVGAGLYLTLVAPALVFVGALSAPGVKSGE